MMKRLLWCLKTGFLCASLFILLGGYSSRVVAQDPLFDLGSGGSAFCGDPCEQSSTNQCFCAGAGSCNGCYIPNGQGGCGNCSRH
jgi:hypothetical protein